MSLNCQLENGVPIPKNNEVLSETVDNMSIEGTSEDYTFSCKNGTLYLSPLRLVYVPNETVNCKFSSIQLPLKLMHGEKFDQPIFFGSPSLSGFVEPEEIDKTKFENGLFTFGSFPQNFEFKIEFKKGKTSPFIQRFFLFMSNVNDQLPEMLQPVMNRHLVEENEQVEEEEEEEEIIAYYNPNDPNQIIVQND
ncbi:ww domain binding protein 2 isoform e [Anaeramoeba flamelloides]|uniref:Ww domain binding protein 2 isoform e n=1 Tax=Anaeramoeba flamelloides TaxID=1746091 RepID=A0AAV7YLM2_9EUKA|nr:ww domain binding protein 2 isoform e [Anaeramoeba flamelloides]